MRTRLAFACLALFGMALTLALLADTVAAGPETDFCRRVYGTDEWTRRCAKLTGAIDPAAYCRRVHGTDEWTRRCARLAGAVDPAAYCRRVHGTDEWTRRCLTLQPATTRPDPANPVVPDEGATRRPATR